MSAVLTVDDRGVVVLEISDADGEVHPYRLEPAAPGLDDRAFWITRLDTGDCYRLALDGRRWTCDCPSHRYRRNKNTPAGCKHTASITPLWRFLERLG